MVGRRGIYNARHDRRCMLTISIVSHGHGALVADLLRDLDAVVAPPFRVLLTHNIPEPDPPGAAALRYPLSIIRNARPQGFGANHNAACRAADGEFFCVINPDVRLPADPFPHLLGTLADPAAGVVAPVIMDVAGNVESTARRFPTPFSIVRKALFGAPALEYALEPQPLQVDWLSGVFLVLRREVYQRAGGGFDEALFSLLRGCRPCARACAPKATACARSPRCPRSTRRGATATAGRATWPGTCAACCVFLTRYAALGSNSAAFGVSPAQYPERVDRSAQRQARERRDVAGQADQRAVRHKQRAGGNQAAGDPRPR